VFALTQRGRVEATNYRTVKLPTDLEVPLHVKDQFGDFYRAMFSEQVRRERMSTLFTEYAWDMRSCDPCVAEPLSTDELTRLGVSRPSSVFITRLHVRYDANHFPEDLVFQETADRGNFQGRYILRHAWSGDDTCAAASEYRAIELPRRREREARNLAWLTGWNLGRIRQTLAQPPTTTGG
jgi:hypothetical protein